MSRRTLFSFAGLAGAAALALIALAVWLPRLQAQPDLTALKPLPLLGSSGGANPAGMGGGGSEALAAVDAASKMFVTGTFSGTEFILGTDLPGFSGPLPVYNQPQGAALRLEAFRELAGRFGVEGPVYTEQMMVLYDAAVEETQMAPDAPASYLIFDGMRQVSGGGYWNGVTYMDRSVPPITQASEIPAFDQLAAAAEAFLNERGLLDFPYRVTSDPYWPAGVRFVRVLGDYALEISEIEVTFGLGGQIQMVSYHPLPVELIADYPLRTAQSAWDALVANEVSWEQMSFWSYLPTTDLFAYQSWQPQYHAGETVEKLGYLIVYEPAAGEQAAQRLMLNDLELQAADADLQTLAGLMNRQLLVWGQVQVTDRGAVVLAVEGWRESEEYGQYFSGSLKRVGQAIIFTRDDGQSFYLPHTPENLPDGIAVDLSGRETGRRDHGLPVMEWDYIQSPPSAAISEGVVESKALGSETSAGSGDVSASGEMTSTMPVEPGIAGPVSWNPPDWEPGKAFENLEGQLYATVFENPDGSLQYNFTLSQMPLEGDGWSMTITSADFEALAALDRQWVRVSGRYQDAEYPAADVERFEAVDAGRPVQAWLGMVVTETLEDRVVAVLETRDGERFVLASTVRWPDSYSMYTYQTGHQFVFEGVVRAETFGGLPVIEEITWNSDDAIDAMTDISQYTMMPRPEFYEYTPPPPLLPGRATVDQVELAYTVVYSWDEATQTSSQIVQPVWRFSGTTEDGTQFVIMIQAVDAAYLK